MRLCMFHPVDRPLERGWVGRVDGDRVVQLAAQTLQHFFTGGASSREHAEYPLAEVVLLAPVAHPPAVRIFDNPGTFWFANPAAVVGTEATVRVPPGAEGLDVLPRLAGVIGAEGAIGGFTLLGECRARGLEPPKDRDFALLLGPLVATPDELVPLPEVVARVAGLEPLHASLAGADWQAMRDYAARDTGLRTGDVIAAPAAGEISGLGSGSRLELEAGPIGVLAAVAG